MKCVPLSSVKGEFILLRDIKHTVGNKRSMFKRASKEMWNFKTHIFSLEYQPSRRVTGQFFWSSGRFIEIVCKGAASRQVR